MKTLLKSMLSIVVLVVAPGVMAQASRLACDDPEYLKRETIATLVEVQGNVLISDAVGMSSATNNQRIKNSVRVTATSRASVMISLDCGCEVQLKENERLDVEVAKQCPALLAAVQAVPIGAPIGAVAAASGSAVPTALLLTSAGVAGYLLYRNNGNVSPN